MYILTGLTLHILLKYRAAKISASLSKISHTVLLRNCEMISSSNSTDCQIQPHELTKEGFISLLYLD